jgi:nitroreductase/NAD-dependent dihydropyrimidine dehydrogenase PreA subunit
MNPEFSLGSLFFGSLVLVNGGDMVDSQFESGREPAGQSYIDSSTCERCGLCAEICPAHILRVIRLPGGEKMSELQAERLFACIHCAHCMAICPTRSIHIAGLSYETDLFDLPESAGREAADDQEAFFNLLASRRSVRVFRDKPVPRELLERILAAVAQAPMGFPPSQVEVTVVASRSLIEQALPLMMELYERLGKLVKNPVARAVIRSRVSPDDFNSLREHVLPMMTYRLPDMRAGKYDAITRGAPALLLFHTQRGLGSSSKDGDIALTYALLAAHALGLGATVIDLVPPAVERTPALRQLFQIPPDNQVQAALVVGYPKFRFRQGIRRKLKNVVWIK